MKKTKIFKILSVVTCLGCGMGIAAVLEYGLYFETVAVVALGAVESILFYYLAKESEVEESYENN